MLCRNKLFLTTCIRVCWMQKSPAEGAGHEPPLPELGFGRVRYSESRRPRLQRAGSRPLPRNCPLGFEHWRHEKQLSNEGMTTSLAYCRCIPRFDPYSTLGTATSAGQKSSSHTRPGRVASNIVSFAHAPETTGVCIHGPAPFIHPSVGASLIVQTMAIIESLQSDPRRRLMSMHESTVPLPSSAINAHSFDFFIPGHGPVWPVQLSF